MDCHCNFLGRDVVGEGGPALTDGVKIGAAEVQRGSGRMVSLHVALPLELCVSHGEDLSKTAVRGYPCGDGCGGGCLKLRPEVGISAL